MGLYQKIRPAKYSDIVGQDVVVRNLLAQSRNEAFFQVFIFGGMYGCGKTTAARVTAMAVNCLHKTEDGDPCGSCESCREILSGQCADVIEIDGASNTGVDNIRELQQQTQYLPLTLRKKVVIIDEVHMLSNAAFNSLLKTLEEPAEHCVYILCTTDVEKIPLTVRSRAACYTFGRIHTNVIADYIESQARALGRELPRESCTLIAKRSDGSMRNALMLLEMILGAAETVSSETVAEILGLSSGDEVSGLLLAILEGDVGGIVERTRRLAVDGRNFYVLSTEILSMVTDVIICAAGGSVDAGEAYLQTLSAFKGYSLPMLVTLSAAAEDIKVAARRDSSGETFLVNCLLASRRVGSICTESVPAAPVPKMEQSAPVSSKASAETAAAAAVSEKAERKPVETDIFETDAFSDDMFSLFSSVGRMDDVTVDEAGDEGFKPCGEAEVPFSDTEAPVVPSENRQENTPLSEEEVPEEEGDYPPFLKKNYFAAELIPTVKKIREICLKDGAVNLHLKKGFELVGDKEKIVLETHDLLAYSAVTAACSGIDGDRLVIRLVM